MCRLVPSEFDSISAGAPSGPSTSILILQPSSASIFGMEVLPLALILRSRGG